MMKNVKENLFLLLPTTPSEFRFCRFALSYFGILLSPMFAVAAMSFSSVSVIANSLRLNNEVENLIKIATNAQIFHKFVY